jgi:hypothetical protein
MSRTTAAATQLQWGGVGPGVVNAYGTSGSASGVLGPVSFGVLGFCWGVELPLKRIGRLRDFKDSNPPSSSSNSTPAGWGGPGVVTAYGTSGSVLGVLGPVSFGVLRFSWGVELPLKRIGRLRDFKDSNPPSSSSSSNSTPAGTPPPT